MKNTVFLLALLMLVLNACDDGDLTIETLDFDDVSIANCGTATTDTRIFFKISGNEALILQLQSGLLANEESVETITSNIGSSGSRLFYRVFSETVTNGYFCDDIPPVEPSVLEEISAEDGQVLVTTTAIDSTSFEHLIQLDNIILRNNLGEQIIDLTVTDFGIITTNAN